MTNAEVREKYENAKAHAIWKIQRERMYNLDMQDIWEMILDRIFDYGENNGTKEHPLYDMYGAIDDSMIYTKDQWTAYMYYCKMGDSPDIMWDNLSIDIAVLVEYILDYKETE